MNIPELFRWRSFRLFKW